MSPRPLKDIRAELDVLTDEFGDEELQQRNAVFDRAYAAAERRVSIIVAISVTLILGAFVAIYLFLRGMIA